MNTKLINLFISISVLFFTSCSDDDVINSSDVKINANVPALLTSDNVEIINLSAEIKLTNKNSGDIFEQTISSFDNMDLNVEDGVYDIMLIGTVKYKLKKVYINTEMNFVDGKFVKTESQVVKYIDSESKIQASKQNENITGGDYKLSMDLYLANKESGFVISEIYFAGSKTPLNKQYSRDGFIEIYNNSDKILYADGLCFGTTEFLSTVYKDAIKPDLRNTRTALMCVYRVPGTGSEYPVAPGKTLLISDIAKDHTIDNSNSVDLSMSNFEWFDDVESKNANALDTDVAEVVNLEKIYSSYKYRYMFHMGGGNSFVLFRMNKSKKDFIAQNVYEYSYLNSRKKEIPKKSYDISNDIIIDAVGCSSKTKFKWNVLSPSLDLSWTYSEEYGHSVKRKISTKREDGTIVLLDTNNSALDFVNTAKPTPASAE